MKKIFILTGEPSGDKLASEVVKKIINFDKDINFLGVCGKHLKALGINSIFDQNEITYLAFSDIILNIFKIRKKINHTVNEIVKFQPDILFTVDSPDFSLRVSNKVKQINPNIKTIHYIAPKVWAWREGRVKKMKKFLDHVLLLFNFEKKYFDKENLKSTFVGHPLLDDQLEKNNISIKPIIDKKIISIFAGSRISEINMLMPILINFIKKMNNKNFDYNYIFHSTEKLSEKLKAKIKENNLHNVDVIHDEKLKSNLLKQSIFAIVKSGTVSLEVIDKIKNIDYAFISIGGGGLIAGMSCVLKQINPKIKIIGVEPINSNVMTNSIKSDKPETFDTINNKTIADTLAAPFAGKITFEYVKEYVDDIINVSEDEMIESLRMMIERLKIVPEPSTSVCFVPTVCNTSKIPSMSKGLVVVCGGNIDLKKIKSLF